MPSANPMRNPIHEVTVHGDYSATGGENGKLLTKRYSITFRIRDDQHKKDGALSVFKHLIAERAIKRDDPTYVGLLTHEILRTVTPGREIPNDVTLMNRTHCLTYIDNEGLPIKPHLYDDISSLQQAIADCEDDTNAFIRNQQVLEKNTRRRPGGTFRDDIWMLNADLFANIEPGAPAELTAAQLGTSNEPLQGVI